MENLENKPQECEKQIFQKPPLNESNDMKSRSSEKESKKVDLEMMNKHFNVTTQ